MNPIEQVLLAFAKKQLQSNPQFISGLLQHILEQNKVDPNVVKIVIELANDLLPLLATQIK